MALYRVTWRELLPVLFAWIILISRGGAADTTPECYNEGLSALPFWYTYLLEMEADPRDALPETYDPTVDCRNMTEVLEKLEEIQEKCSEHLDHYYKLWDLKEWYEEICVEYGCFYAGEHCINTHLHEVCDGKQPDCLTTPYIICDKTLNFYKEDLQDLMEETKSQCHLIDLETGVVMKPSTTTSSTTTTTTTSTTTTTPTTTTTRRTTTTEDLWWARGETRSTQSTTTTTPRPTDRTTERTQVVVQPVEGEGKDDAVVVEPPKDDTIRIRLRLDIEWHDEYLDMSSRRSDNLAYGLGEVFRAIYQQATRLVDQVTVHRFFKGSVNADIILHSAMPLTTEHRATLGIILNETLHSTDQKLQLGPYEIPVLDKSIVLMEKNQSRMVSLDQGRECFALSLNTSCNHGECELTYYGMPRCRCMKGYTGSTCTEKTTTSSDSIAAIVSVSVFGGIIFLLCLVLTVMWACDSSLFKRGKKRLSSKFRPSGAPVHSPSAVPIVNSSPKSKHKPTEPDIAEASPETERLNPV